MHVVDEMSQRLDDMEAAIKAGNNPENGETWRDGYLQSATIFTHLQHYLAYTPGRMGIFCRVCSVVLEVA